MGMGALNSEARVLASIGGKGPVISSFESNKDILHGGVLLAIPALLSNGLLRHENKFFQLPKGYYDLHHIILLLALMALVRLKSIEDLRSYPPGEWGKLIGIDRAPEVKVLREKIAILSQDDKPKQWGAELCRDWISDLPKDAMTFYIDGHVRIYHGHQTKLPRHYLAREKLCARATCDFWVNASDGKPFFYISKAVDPGLLQMVEQEIVPILEKEIKALEKQPTQAELENNDKMHRYQIIFDREAYSPYFMLRMWQLYRISITTYNKHPGDDWPIEDFKNVKTKLKSGEEVEVLIAEKLGERDVLDHGKLVGRLLIREVRRIKNKKQVSIISTNYKSDLISVIILMQDRWSQENFFSYMCRHFGLDHIIDYKLEDVIDTKIVNPMYRKIASEIKKFNSLLVRKRAKFSKIHLDDDIETKEFKNKQKDKSNLIEEINDLELLIQNKKTERKGVKQHITVDELPEEYKFKKLNTQSKYFIDTIKMIAYRAETAMLNICKEKIMPYNITESPETKDSIRSLLRALYESTADLIVNEEDHTLTVNVHNQANKSSDEVVKHMCKILTESETQYPGTNLRMIFKLVSDKFVEIR